MSCKKFVKIRGEGYQRVGIFKERLHSFFVPFFKYETSIFAKATLLK